ncbi:MAG: peptide/nickel transport system ATP-binding protein [Actinomycetota bacterium]|jgi:oligopeptide/dipeptide ABC transporter ATP-binding protein|nr:peptide/nickel transport system ATP-binding protein [Actinomycetota bacterium]
MSSQALTDALRAGAAGEPPSVGRRGRGRNSAGRRLVAAVIGSPTGVLSALAVVVMLFLVIAGPSIWGDAARQIDVTNARLGSSGAHPFGTDNAGRDILARMLSSARLSLGLAVVTVLLGAAVGIPLGAVVGVLGPRLRRLLGEGINLLLAFPGILVALFVTAVLGPGISSVVIALAIASAPSFARLSQTLASSLAQADYVAAARIAGFSRRRVLFRHILPNVAEPLVLTTALAAGGTLLAFAALSFLGLGIQPPDYDWGRVLNDGLLRLYDNPLSALGPGAMIVLAGMAFNLIGDTLARFAAGAEPAPHVRRVARADGASPAAFTAASRPAGDVLHVRGLRLEFGGIPVVDGVDLDIARGERVALVGESGSGKTLTALAAARLAPPAAHVEVEEHSFLGTPLTARTAPAVLGTGMALVFQDPLSSWNPALKVGTQLIEGAVRHQGVSRRGARSRAESLLAAVRVTSPRRRLTQYPYELSGGMRQRAMIASGLMTDPALIIADEPTTALDVTVQRQVLRVLRESTASRETALLLISHDLGVVAQLCDRVLVMYAGRIVEDAPLEHLLSHQEHPYTAALLSTMPTLETDLDAALPAISGSQPEPEARPTGCPFRTRCPRATSLCEESPPLAAIGPAHLVACWHPVTTSESCTPAGNGAGR